MDGIFRDKGIEKEDIYSLSREFPLNKLRGEILEKIEVEDKQWAFNFAEKNQDIIMNKEKGNNYEI